MARSKFKRNGEKCDGRTFVRLPNVVLQSPGYRMLGHAARALLIDIAMQYGGHNNGKLTACAKYLRPLGWKSNNTVLRALRELQSCGLLIETRKGARPNRAAWFALSWLDLDQGTGLDIDPKQFRRGAYMAPEGSELRANAAGRTLKATEARKASALRNRQQREIAALSPSNGAAPAPIAPSDGVRDSILEPLHGAIRGDFGPLPTPLNGAYLEMPSATGSMAGTAVSAV